MFTYGTLAGIFSRVADVVCRQLDGPLVQRGQEGFGKGDFGHDDLLEAGVQRFFVERLQVDRVCLFGVVISGVGLVWSKMERDVMLRRGVVWKVKLGCTWSIGVTRACGEGAWRKELDFLPMYARNITMRPR